MYTACLNGPNAFGKTNVANVLLALSLTFQTCTPAHFLNHLNTWATFGKLGETDKEQR